MLPDKLINNAATCDFIEATRTNSLLHPLVASVRACGEVLPTNTCVDVKEASTKLPSVTQSGFTANSTQHTDGLLQNTSNEHLCKCYVYGGTCDFVGAMNSLGYPLVASARACGEFLPAGAGVNVKNASTKPSSVTQSGFIEPLDLTSTASSTQYTGRVLRGK